MKRFPKEFPGLIPARVVEFKDMYVFWGRSPEDKTNFVPCSMNKITGKRTNWSPFQNPNEYVEFDKACDNAIDLEN